MVNSFYCFACLAMRAFGKLVVLVQRSIIAAVSAARGSAANGSQPRYSLLLHGAVGVATTDELLLKAAKGHQLLVGLGKFFLADNWLKP